jgi:hypothetical protein
MVAQLSQLPCQRGVVALSPEAEKQPVDALATVLGLKRVLPVS